jgi:hypothetical protein
MQYLTLLPTIKYKFETGEYTVADLFTRVGFKSTFFSNNRLYYEEKIDPIISPERLSDKIYGTYDYYWLLMLANNVYDVNLDWPASQDQFNRDLDNLGNKLVYYIYQNGEILPNDILWHNDGSYGVIESWDPFYKSIVIKENYSLPTSNVQNLVFEIRRINKNGSYTNITNYCSTSNTQFTSFGFKKYLESISQISSSSGQFLNPFCLVSNGVVTSDILLDTCEDSDKVQFQDSLIYQIVNNQSISGVSVKNQQFRLTLEYVNKTNLKIINPAFAPLYEDTVTLLYNDPTIFSATMIRID